MSAFQDWWKRATSGPSEGHFRIDKRSAEIGWNAAIGSMEARPQADNTASSTLLSIGSCEGCWRFRKGKRWGMDCTYCIRNTERITDNYREQRPA